MSEPPARARRAAEVQAPTRLQRAIARRAAEARATIPHLELETGVDIGAALEECRSQGHSLDAVLVRACARALREHPRANAAYRDGQFELYERVNPGLLLSDEDDLVVATLFDADRQSLAELTSQIQELRERTDALTQPERSGATFTLSREDRSGVDRQAPIVWSGQAAALAAGAVREAPVVRDRDVIPGRLMTVVLACDHRILYGARAARFLGRIRELIEQPL